MNIHILGICGTFMGGLAILAREMGHEVSGSDENIYPPMSDQLSQQKITLFNGYKIEHLTPHPDLIIVGNSLSRGNPAIEYILENNLKFTSGPQWLYENVLNGKHVLAVSGTHGKTSTTTILTWILEEAGLNPGFLIGGMAENFGCSARFTESDYFVIEADEYDTAFFDKRSKFVHYRPKTLIINNLEYDHADIFADLAAIRREFHHMIRIMPASGLVIGYADTTQIDQVLEMGCWSRIERFAGKNSKWQLTPTHRDFSSFNIFQDAKPGGQVNWSLIGQFNAENALAAIAAAANIGVSSKNACKSLSGFKSVKRRLELLDVVNGISVYDDFAHHPTAIRLTLKALRSKVNKERIIAILEPRSNTMKQGVHKDLLARSLIEADFCLVFQPKDLDWDMNQYLTELGEKCEVHQDIEIIITRVLELGQNGDHILIMSNGGFEGIHKKLIKVLKERI